MPYSLHRVRMNTLRFVSLSLLAIGSTCTVLIGAITRANQTSADTAIASTGQEKLTKVAQGEYAVLEGPNVAAIGPFGEEVYDFHENWTALAGRGSADTRLKERGDSESPKVQRTQSLTGSAFARSHRNSTD